MARHRKISSTLRSARGNTRGVALTVVAIVILMVGLLAGYVTQLGFNQRKLSDAASGKRAKIYYRAQAGAVEAMWRIRANYTTGLDTVGSFTTDAYNPGPYSIDIDGDSVMDATIDIGAANVTTKQRAILATGLDV